jgi:single-strand DNA-binding protein
MKAPLMTEPTAILVKRYPKFRYTPKGTPVTAIGLALNRIYSTEDGQKKEETTFVDVVLFGRQAEIAGQYLKKGRPVFIEGRLQLSTWVEKDSGQKRNRLKVIGENLLIGSRTESEGGSDVPAASRPRSVGRPQSLEDFEPGQEVPF